MKAKVIKSYQRPYDNPISVASGERVFPNQSKETDIPGGIWCKAENGREGWTPISW